MKIVVAFNFVLLVLIFSGCRQDLSQTTKPEKDTKVKREVFDIEKYPGLTAVGKINFTGQKWCSATLVSDDIVITAGHCFLESNLKFDPAKDVEPYFTTVIFKPDGRYFIENVNVKRVLKAKMNPDFAIVKLDKKIPGNQIKPLKISNLTFDKMLSKQEQLGCAGYNGDKELGDLGWTMTISRNIKIIPETSGKDRIDTNCVSTYGGSGGLFYEEKYNEETKTNEYLVVGIVWGLTDGKYDLQGEAIEGKESITSITPVSAFYDELTEIIEKNQKEEKNGKGGTENKEK